MSTCIECSGPLASESGSGICDVCSLKMALVPTEVALDTSHSSNSDEAAHGSTGSTIPGEEVPGGIMGAYRLVEKLGEGGFGSVWLAEQQEPVVRKVALKIIKLGMDTREVIARFGAERQALAMMEHRHIAKVLDAGSTETGRPYFVMELVDGKPITDFCDQEKLPVRKRLELFLDVCSAVQHAHQKGIIHRDLKPSNILITREGAKAVAKVIDFGIAKAMEDPITDRSVATRMGQILGTPIYMSPEQASMRSQDVDTRSDVYSLGVVLYELLTGQSIFDLECVGKTPHHEVFQLISENIPEKPSTRLRHANATRSAEIAGRRGSQPEQLNRILKSDLDWIVMKALEKSKESRYATAEALAQDMQRFLDGRPTDAHPPTTTYLVGKWAARYKAVLVVSSLILIGLLAFGLVSNVLYQRAEDARINERDALIGLKKARAGEREASGELLYQAAAFRRNGDLKQALVLLDEADTILGRKDAHRELQRIEILHADSRPREALDVLVALREKFIGELTDQQQALEQMWTAELEHGNDWNAAAKAYSGALILGLPKADELYVRAQMAPATPEVKRQLRAALEVEPFHYRAIVLLSFIEVVTGDHQAAASHIFLGKKVYPGDFNFAFAKAIQQTVLGDFDSGQKTIQEAEPDADLAQAAIDALFVFRLMRSIAEGFERTGGDDELQSTVRAITMRQLLGQRFVIRPDQFQMAPWMRAILVAPINDIVRAPANPGKAREHFERSLEKNPEAGTAFMAAYLAHHEAQRYRNSTDKTEKETYKELLRHADRLAEQCANLPAMIPEFSSEAHYFRGFINIELFLADVSADERKAEEAKQRAVDSFWTYVREGNRVFPHRLSFLATFQRLNDWDLLIAAQQKLVDSDPGNQAWNRRLIELLIDAGNLGSARAKVDALPQGAERDELEERLNKKSREMLEKANLQVIRQWPSAPNSMRSIPPTPL